MRIYIDKSTGRGVLSEKFNSLVSLYEFKRGDTAKVEIGYVQDGVLVPLNGGFIIIFGIKEAGKYDGDYLVHESLFTYNAATGFYEGEPDFNTTELNDLLNADDGDDTNDIAKIDCLFEITASDDDGIFSSNTATARVHHDVNKGNEGIPTGANPSYAPLSHSHTTDSTLIASGGLVTEDAAFSGTVTATGNTGADEDEVMTYGEAALKDWQLGATDYINIVDTPTEVKTLLLGQQVQHIQAATAAGGWPFTGTLISDMRLAPPNAGYFYCSQTLTEYESGGRIWIRKGNNSTTWHDWQEVLNLSNGVLNEDLTVSGQVSLSGLTEYADDTSAGVGGLVAGDLYTTTGTIKIKL